MRGEDRASGTGSSWVLVVDGDATRRMALFRIVERMGHHVTVADSGPAAVELLRTEPFDVVVVDTAGLGSDHTPCLAAMDAAARLRPVPVVEVDSSAEHVDPDTLHQRIDAALAATGPAAGQGP